MSNKNEKALAMVANARKNIALSSSSPSKNPAYTKKPNKEIKKSQINLYRSGVGSVNVIIMHYNAW